MAVSPTTFTAATSSIKSSSCPPLHPIYDPIKNGQEITIVFVQDATGGHTVTGWPTGVEFDSDSFVPTAGGGKGSSVTLMWAEGRWWEKSRAMNMK